jgi:carbon-monoxide dehydrogenase medium subunit
MLCDPDRTKGGRIMNHSFQPNEYLRPKDISEAAKLLSNYGNRARIIAGGSDLLVFKPQGVECLIDLSNLDLSYINKEKDEIVIGASTILNDIEHSSLLASGPYKIVSEAVSALATQTIRNMATIGGNLCNASPAADLPPALMVLDATLKVAGNKGNRVIAVADLFENVKRTALAEGEFLVEVLVPQSPGNTGASFQKLRHHQTSIDIAIVNAAARLTCENEICKEVRIALGAVAPTPVYAEGAERLLQGKKINLDLIQKAAEAASEEAKPIDDIRASAGYRKKMVAVLVRRALEESAGRCGIWEK